MNKTARKPANAEGSTDPYYRLLEADTKTRLEEQVQKLYEEGYKIHGNAMTGERSEGARQGPSSRYAQVMTKDLGPGTKDGIIRLPDGTAVLASTIVAVEIQDVTRVSPASRRCT